MPKITTTTDVKLGRFYAGPHIPDGAEIIGTVSRSATDTGALLRLANGIQVQFNAGVIRNLPAQVGRPHRYGEPTVRVTLSLPESVYAAIPKPQGPTLAADAIKKYGKGEGK